LIRAVTRKKEIKLSLIYLPGHENRCLFSSDRISTRTGKMFFKRDTKNFDFFPLPTHFFVPNHDETLHSQILSFKVITLFGYLTWLIKIQFVIFELNV
jgi:hypothetical protein